MDKREGEKLLFEKINNQIKESGWWIFNKRNIELTITRILEPYEKKANLPLPEKLQIDYLYINKDGIGNHTNLIKWSEICATGISKEFNEERNGEDNFLESNGEDYFYISKLHVCLNNKRILEFELGDISQLKGLLGHFIELYKDENKKPNL